MSNLLYLTYDEWLSLGYYVRKGQIHRYRRKNGDCVFSELQVSKKERIGVTKVRDDHYEKVIDILKDVAKISYYEPNVWYNINKIRERAYDLVSRLPNTKD